MNYTQSEKFSRVTDRQPCFVLSCFGIVEDCSQFRGLWAYFSDWVRDFPSGYVYCVYGHGNRQIYGNRVLFGDGSFLGYPHHHKEQSGLFYPHSIRVIFWEKERGKKKKIFWNFFREIFGGIFLSGFLVILLSRLRIVKFEKFKIGINRKVYGKRGKWRS